MTNGRIDEAQIELMLTGLPEGSPERDRAKYTLTCLSVLNAKVASIAQHCRYCDDSDDDQPTPADSEQGRQHWLMWLVGTNVVTRIVLPLAVSAGGVVITLAITGQL